MNGLLLIDKPEGMTSHDVVAIVRKTLQTREVGHSGTLDPMATGLMVLLLGEATKLSSYVTDSDKTYQVTLKLGIETDTLDSTGEITKTSDVRVGRSDVMLAAQKISGELSLPIPMYSAKKIDGKKMYEYARESKSIEQPEKVMKFWGIFPIENSELHGPKGSPENHEYSFELSCSKGSFIRSWVSELGHVLGCGAIMTGLRRTRSSSFGVNQGVTLDHLKTLTTNGEKPPLVPLTEAINEIKKLKVKDMDLNLLKNGQISLGLRTQLIRVFDPEKDALVRIHAERPERLIALIGMDAVKGFVIRRIFNS